jgi:hypothetical protein
LGANRRRGEISVNRYVWRWWDVHECFMTHHHRDAKDGILHDYSLLSFKILRKVDFVSSVCFARRTALVLDECFVAVFLIRTGSDELAKDSIVMLRSTKSRGASVTALLKGVGIPKCLHHIVLMIYTIPLVTNLLGVDENVSDFMCGKGQ